MFHYPGPSSSETRLGVELGTDRSGGLESGLVSERGDGMG